MSSVSELPSRVARATPVHTLTLTIVSNSSSILSCGKGVCFVNLKKNELNCVNFELRSIEYVALYWRINCRYYECQCDRLASYPNNI